MCVCARVGACMRVLVSKSTVVQKLQHVKNNQKTDTENDNNRLTTADINIIFLVLLLFSQTCFWLIRGPS